MYWKACLFNSSRSIAYYLITIQFSSWNTLPMVSMKWLHGIQNLYYLISGAVFDNFRAQVTTLDGTKVLLVAFSIAGILVKHVRRSCLSLCLDYGIPQLLCLYLFSSSSFLFVTALKTHTFEIIYIWQ